MHTDSDSVDTWVAVRHEALTELSTRHYLDNSVSIETLLSISVIKPAVLDAATRLFTVNPRASTQEVAAAAGISRATLHRLFPSRDALIEGLGLLALVHISEAYAAAHLDEGTAPEALQRLIEALVHIHQFAYLVGETELQQNDAMMAGDRAVQEQTERFLRRGQDEGSLRVDLPVVWMAHTLAGLLLAAEEAVVWETSRRARRRDSSWTASLAAPPAGMATQRCRLHATAHERMKR